MNDENLWQQGCIGIPVGETELVKVHYWAKIYDEPSPFGIDGGRISKLTLKINDKIICHYDRSWNIKPTDDDQYAMIALSILMLQNW